MVVAANYAAGFYMSIPGRAQLDAGIVAFQDKRYRESEVLLQEAIRIHGPSAEALFYLGLILSARGALDKALQAIDQSFQLQPSIETAFIGAELAFHAKDRAQVLAWSGRMDGTELTHLPRILNLADTHAAADFTRAAANYFSAALRLTPDDFEILKRYAYYSGAHGRDKVLTALDSYVARHAHRPDILCIAYALLLPLREASLRAQAGLNQFHETFDLRFTFARDEVMKWYNASAAWLAADPNNTKAHISMALAWVARGQPLEAEPHLAKVRATGKRTIHTKAHFGADFFTAVEAAQRDLGAGLPVVETLKAPTPKTGIVFVGANFDYFERFGWVLVKSFIAFPSTTDLHLHIFDLEPAQRADFIVRLDAIMGGRPYGLTTETTGVAHDKKLGRITYHAARFIRAAQVADAHAVPFALIDADTIFTGSSDRIFADIDGYDGRAITYAGLVECHNQIAACVLILGNTDLARAYLRRVAAYLAVSRVRGEWIWGIDQIALYAVYVEMAARAQAPHLAGMPRTLFTSMLTEGTLLWPGKAFADDPAFAAFDALRTRYT